MASKISVIVPIYNVERYLRECVDSILAQTYTNIEIILVNDGSLDRCGDICDEYARKDNRIVVINKENGGLSDARNAGIDIASGEYLHFIDSDDWVEADMLEVLYHNLVKHDADISCCGYFYSYVNSNKPLNDKDEIIIFNNKQAIEQILLDKYKTMPTIAPCKLYKRYIFNEIRYPFGKHHEDEFVIVDVLSKAHIIVIDTTPKYYYRQRKGSIVRGADYHSNANDMLDALELRVKQVEENHMNLHDMAKTHFLIMNLGLLHRLIFIKDFKAMPEYNKIVSALRNNYKFIINSDIITNNEKIKLLAIKLNITLYKLLQSINDICKKRKSEKDGVLFD